MLWLPRTWAGLAGAQITRFVDCDPDGLVSSRRRWAMALIYGTSLLHHDLIESACYSSIAPRSPRHLGIGFQFVCVGLGYRQNGAHARRP